MVSLYNIHRMIESVFLVSFSMFIYGVLGFLKEIENFNFMDFDVINVLNTTTNILYLVALYSLISAINDICCEYSFKLEVCNFNKELEEELERENKIIDDYRMKRHNSI